MDEGNELFKQTVWAGYHPSGTSLRRPTFRATQGRILMGKREPEKGLPANYGGATPEEVAVAVLRYRPGKKNKPQPQAKKEQAETLNPTK